MKTRAALAVILVAALVAAVVETPTDAAEGAEGGLKPHASCWTAVPQRQGARIRTLLRGWPSSVRREAARNNAAFPCNIVLSVSFSNNAVQRHIAANPMPQAGNWVSADSPAGDVIAYDPSRPDEMPGHKVDADIRTMAAGARETFAPRSDTRRRDCIGMQTVTLAALNKLPASMGLEAHMLVIGNESMGRFPASGGSYLLGLDPIDNGVHHVVGLWPKLRGRQVSDGIPESAIVLDYWPMQDAAAADNVMGKRQFTANWSDLERTGPLRVEDGAQ